MSKKYAMAGRNPFDEWALRESGVREEIEEARQEPKHPLTRRMRRASAAALAQKARTEEEIRRQQIIETAARIEADRHHNHSQLEEAIEMSEETLEILSHPAQLTGKQIWYTIWCVVWALATLVAMAHNVLGGLILSIPLFFIFMYISRSPDIYKGALGDGWRSSSGGV